MQNHWVFVLATEPDMTPEAATKVRYSGKKLVEDVREALREHQLVDVAKLLFVFEQFDRSKDNFIQPAELQAGLEKF